MRMLKAGALYYALVFGAGFVLGPIRVLWVVPRSGERTAELMETPIMLVVTILAARGLRLDDHGALHRGRMEVAMVRVGPGTREGVLEPIPRFEQRRPAPKRLPPS